MRRHARCIAHLGQDDRVGERRRVTGGWRTSTRTNADSFTRVDHSIEPDPSRGSTSCTRPWSMWTVTVPDGTLLIFTLITTGRGPFPVAHQLRRCGHRRGRCMRAGSRPTRRSGSAQRECRRARRQRRVPRPVRPSAECRSDHADECHCYLSPVATDRRESRPPGRVPHSARLPRCRRSRASRISTAVPHLDRVESVKVIREGATVPTCCWEVARLRVGPMSGRLA
jgi:hypothetical protein